MTTDKEETKAHEFPIELVEKELEGDATLENPRSESSASLADADSEGEA